MSGGTVNISRSIWSDTAFKKQPFTEREAFMWLVMEASWKPRERRVGNVVVNLDRGQLVASVRFMAEAWAWQKSTVDRFLKRLENRDMIGTASGTGVNVITVCKYNEYQNDPDHIGTSNKSKAGQQRDSSGTNENKDSIPEEIPEQRILVLHSTEKPAQTSDPVAEGFTEFWEKIWPSHPRKAGKADCWKIYSQACTGKHPKSDRIDPTALNAATRAYIESVRDPQYLKAPLPWLRLPGWEPFLRTAQRDQITPDQQRYRDIIAGSRR